MMQYFVGSLYFRIKTFEINETRKKMFLSKGVSFDKLLTTKNVMHYKIFQYIYLSVRYVNQIISQITQRATCSTLRLGPYQ